jgi:choline dehydrogenase-like flavoprotein
MLRTARAAGAPTMDDDVRYSTPRHGTLPMTTDDMLRQEWDVIVVGTGMGGATIGHALARAGRRVLFCELGGATHGQLRGGYPELDQGRSGAVLDGSQRALLAGAGRCADTLVDASTSRPRRFVPFIGSGRGGSSALYGMALERFARADFEPGAYHRGADGAAVAERWPIGYDELAPWYAAAEALYRVRGEPDPLAAAPGGSDGPALMPPPPLSSAAGELRGFLAGRGLHPYQLPAACEHVAGCQSCQGLLCPMPCKNDADRICLQPALAEHGAALLEGCRVLAVTTEGRRARGVDCHWSGREWHLRARTVVLAAGALQTPLILRRSDGGRGQPGLGNRSGLVGRHLMRHLIDLYLVRPADASAPDFDNRRKEVAFNDFYADGGDKLGTVQSFGRLPPAGMLFGALQDDLRASRWGWAAPALGLARPLLHPILHDMSEGWLTLAAIIEDLPYADHRVEPDAAGPDTARLHYRLRPEAHRRVARLRGHMAGVLQGRKWRRLPQVDNNQRIAHACGTCRFGDDPRSSVLDRDNRVHEVDNLFVVDSSFFPSSAGTNPSLTIAANALRVAQRIVEQGP